VELSLEGLVKLLESSGRFGFLFTPTLFRPAFEFDNAMRETATRMNLPAKTSTTALASELSEHIADLQIGERLQMLARLCDAVKRPSASNILGYVGASAVIAVFKQGMNC
jgi:hypothetical protein